MDVVTRSHPVKWDDLDYGTPFLSYVLGEARLCMKVRQGSGASRLSLFVVLAPGLDDIGGLPAAYADPLSLGATCFYHSPSVVIRPDVSSLIDITHKPEGGELYVDGISYHLFIRHEKRLQPLDLRSGVLRSRAGDNPEAVMFRRWHVMESQDRDAAEIFRFAAPA